MEDIPRRRTRATGFSPGGPRELMDAPRRPTRGGRRTTAVDNVAAPIDTRTATAVPRATRRAKALSSESVDNTDVTDMDVDTLARRGRGQTRSARARTRSSSPLELIEPANSRSRSPQRAAARSPRPTIEGRAKGRGKRARVEEIAEVSGSAAGNGEDDLGERDAPRPAKKVRAGAKSGEELRRKLEREKALASLAQAVSASKEASVSSVEVDAPKDLGMIADNNVSIARGSGGASPCTTAPLEVASREAPLVIESIEAPLASIEAAATLDGGARSPAILHERTGEELIAEQRIAANHKKWVRLGRRHAPVMKAPSECGSDEEEAGKAALAFMNELRPPPLPTYESSKRYVEWTEGKSGMLVVEVAGKVDADAVAAKKRMIRRRFLKPSSLVQDDCASKPVLVQTLIGDANILAALTTTLDWLNSNKNTVPTASEVVKMLDKFKMEKTTTKSRTFRAPSPSDPLSSDDFDSDGEPIPRYRPRRVRKPATPPPPPPVPALLKPSFTGKADSHLPMIYRGVQFKLLPKELQDHPLSWRIKERDAIFAANSPPDAAEAAFSAKQARKAADAARKAAAMKAAKEKAEPSRKPAHEAAEKSTIATPSTIATSFTPTTPSQMSVSTLGDINTNILTGPITTTPPTISSNSFGLFFGKNYLDDSDSDTDMSDGEADNAPGPVDAAGKIRDATSNVQISPQIEVIPRKPRVVRETFHRPQRPHKSEIKKLFIRKFFNASQEYDSSPTRTPTPQRVAPVTAPTTPPIQPGLDTSPRDFVSPEIQAVVDSIDFQNDLAAFDNTNLPPVFSPTPSGFDISPEIQSIVDSTDFQKDLAAIDNTNLLRVFSAREFVSPEIQAVVDSTDLQKDLAACDNTNLLGVFNQRRQFVSPEIQSVINSNDFQKDLAALDNTNLLRIFRQRLHDAKFTVDPGVSAIVDAIPAEELQPNPFWGWGSGGLSSPVRL